MENRPYVFISYAHMDSAQVLPCIRALQNSGINLWFDEGIAAGSEWPEYIAQKVVGCEKMVLFISNAFLNSQNCKRELNFGISRKKDILSIYLEDVKLSPGVEMQLGTYQAIYRNRFDSDEVFRNALSNEAYFDRCRAVSAPVSRPQPAPQTEPQPAPQTEPQPPFAGYEELLNYRRPDNTQTQTPPPAAPQSAPQSAPQQPYYQPPVQNPYGGYQPNAHLPVKNRYVAALLAIFLGMFGVHWFYLRKPVWGIVSLVFCWTYIPGLLGVVHGLMMLFMDDRKFEQKYNCRVG